MVTVIKSTANNQHIYSVSELNQRARLLLESEFSSIWLEGEISNLALPQSGHAYFSLKDSNAQVRCALFRGVRSASKLSLTDGLQVLVQAKVSLYPNRGDFQLIIESIQEVGDGALQRQFEQLKKQLQARGWFEQGKHPLPKLPKAIGVVTSSTGAAIRDILSVLKRRFAAIPVVVYPTEVQGKQAANSIAGAINLANQHNYCDVLILARGGGSLEDLWGFNEEVVAQAIFDSKIAIISGVGHETDVTISDFVACQRAATPTAAAELATPNMNDWLMQLQQCSSRMNYQMNHLIRNWQQQVDFLSKRLVHPKTRIEAARALQQQLSQRLTRAMNAYLNQSQQQLHFLTQSLIQISPLATLKRGYAIVSDEKGKPIDNTAELAPQQKLTTRLHSGKFTSVVVDIHSENN